MTTFPLTDTEMYVRNPDAYRKAEAMVALMESIDCGPADRSCDLDYSCPAHGGDRRDDDGWTATDETALSEFERRRDEALSLASGQAVRTPTSHADPAAVDTGAASSSSCPVPVAGGQAPASIEVLKRKHRADLFDALLVSMQGREA